MRISALAHALVLTLVVTSCDSPLDKAKNEAILKLSTNSPLLLKEVTIEEMEIGSETRGPEGIAVEGGTIFTINPVDKKSNRRGTLLEFAGFSAQVVKFAGKDQFSKLPPAWGNNDLDKLRTICDASRRTIEAASNFHELKEAVVLVTARGGLAPPGAFDRLIWLKGDRFSGLLTGNFNDGYMALAMSPANKPEVYYVINFVRKVGASHDQVLAFTKALAFEPSAEQVGADQSATGPQLKAQDKEKPQPESEGRSR